MKIRFPHDAHPRCHRAPLRAPAEGLSFSRLPFLLPDRIDQRGESLNPHFQPVAGHNGSHAARRSGENDVPGQQRQVRRDETDEVEAVEDE